VLGEAVDGMALYTGIQLQRQILHPETELRKVAHNYFEWRDLIRLCTGLGCDINEKDGMGYTPLLIAAWRFSYCTFRLGFTLNPDDYADYIHDTEAYKILVSLGADINATDRNGRTVEEMIIRQVGLKIAAEEHHQV